jgi:hypothetical protein
MSLWDKGWPGPSIRLGLALGAAPLDSDARIPYQFMPLELLGAPVLVTANYAARPGQTLLIDSEDAPITITAYAAPVEGQAFITLIDIKGTWRTNNVTFDPGAVAIAVPGGADATGLVCSEDHAVAVIGFAGAKYRIL